MSVLDKALWTLAFLLAYLVAPTTLIWGWMSWCWQEKARAISSILSFIGFTLASASAVLALSAIAFAELGGFQSNSGFFLFAKAIKTGGILSSAGFLFSLAGLWQKSPTRWQAPASAIGTLVFWLVATTWP